MLIDCDACAARGIGCQNCVVTVILGAPPAAEVPDRVDLDPAERAAIAVLAGSGLVPPLRLAVGPCAPGDPRTADRPDRRRPPLRAAG